MRYLKNFLNEIAKLLYKAIITLAESKLRWPKIDLTDEKRKNLLRDDTISVVYFTVIILAIAFLDVLFFKELGSWVNDGVEQILSMLGLEQHTFKAFLRWMCNWNWTKEWFGVSICFNRYAGKEVQTWGHVVVAWVMPFFTLRLFNNLQRDHWKYWGWGGVVTGVLIVNMMLQNLGVVKTQIVNRPFNTFFNFLVILVFGIVIAIRFMRQNHKKEEDDKINEDNYERVSRIKKEADDRIENTIMVQRQNPHFVSNALMRMKPMVFQAKPIELFNELARLGELIETHFKESEKSIISLADEILFMDKYVNWQMDLGRFDKRTRALSFDIEDYSDKLKGVLKHYQDYYLVPLVAVPFVENAFKYGVSHDEKPFQIYIDLKEENGWLELTIWNTLSGFKSEQGGFGTTNIKRILASKYTADEYNLYDGLDTYRGGRREPREELKNREVYQIILKIKLIKENEIERHSRR